MNYYEKHIGDYIRDTVSLTMTEDGAYGRLMDQVYQSEKPLPLDKKMIYRLARAASTSDRKAVDFVLATFFQETDEGYVQKRITKEIERYQEKQRKAKASAEARWNKPKQDANASQTHDASDMRTHSEGNAHQPPDTSNQTPDTSKPPTVPDDSPTPSAVGALCIAMRAAGVQAQPHDPRMMALAKQGVTPETLTAACLEAKKSKPLDRITPGYVLGILLRWSKEAEQLNVAGATQPAGKKPGIAEQLEARKNRGTDPDLIDLN